jgi:hypothetical protein
MELVICSGPHEGLAVQVGLDAAGWPPAELHHDGVRHVLHPFGPDGGEGWHYCAALPRLARQRTPSSPSETSCTERPSATSLRPSEA